MTKADRIREKMRCPLTKSPLHFENGVWISAEGRRFPSIDGTASLVFPEEIQVKNAKMNRMYDLLAPFYIWSENVIGGFFTGIDMRGERQKMLAIPVYPMGGAILEVSSGPGVNLQALRRQVGSDGSITALDLSLEMLRQCRKTGLADAFVRANGSYLPFADDSFDGLFHFGGVNLFDEPDKALAEFVRVVKPGALIAWGDEGFAPDLPNTWRTRFLDKVNPGYRKPIAAVPSGVRDVTVHRVMGRLAWLATATKI